MLLLLGIAGLKLLGVVIDVIRYALDPSLPPPVYPFGWNPPAGWSALQIVTALALAIVAQAVLRAALTYAYNMITARLTQGEIVPELRAQLYAKLQRLSFSFFDLHGSNSIFNRVTGDVQNTRLFVDGVLLQGVNMILTLAAYAFFMWRIQPSLTVACLSVSVPLWWLAHFYSARLRPGYLRNRELTDNMVLLFSESVRGMQTVKGFAAEPHQVRRFEEANDLVSSQQRKIFWDLSLFTPGTQMLSQLSLVILFAYGGWLYVQGKIPLGSGLVVFAGLLQQFTGQVATISTIANSVQQSLAAARRVFEVMDTPVEVQSRPNAIKPARLTGRMIFEKVTFGYHADKPVLTEVSFEAKPGQVIGIFGMTGAGKSSLLGLIPRFYDPTAGRILADGKDLRELDLDAFRRQIGIVYQESFLFSNTVSANIAFGHPHATMEQIERAARIASAHEFITALPHGLRNGAGRIGRGFVGRTASAAGAGAGVVAATADSDSGRPDGIGGCADGKRDCVGVARGDGGTDDVCGVEPVEPVAAGGFDSGAGGRAADAIGHARGIGASSGAVSRNGAVADHGFGGSGEIEGELKIWEHRTFNIQQRMLNLSW